VIAFRRAGLVFVFNFHPQQSPFGYRIAAPPGRYRMVLDSDALLYGGYGRLSPGQEHLTLHEQGRDLLALYLPTRTGIVLQPLS
jgi:1,4-alpha-glucan branching enzyme